MNLSNNKIALLFIFCASLIIISACNSTNKTAKSDISTNTVDPARENISYQDLGEYLKRVPGVMVQKSGDTYRVNVRGSARMTGDTEPLFVINNVPVGDYAQAAALVDPMDIDRVRVIKDVASTSAYGMRGAFGVIVIYLKKGGK